MKQKNRTIKRICFICEKEINEHKQYYISYGECCAECNARCGKVARKEITKEQADKILLKLRKKNEN